MDESEVAASLRIDMSQGSPFCPGSQDIYELIAEHNGVKVWRCPVCKETVETNLKALDVYGYHFIPGVTPHYLERIIN